MRELLPTKEGPELRTTAWLCWKRRRGLKEAKLKRCAVDMSTIRGARTALRYAHLPRSMRAIGCAMSAAGTPDALLA